MDSLKMSECGDQHIKTLFNCLLRNKEKFSFAFRNSPNYIEFSLDRFLSETRIYVDAEVISIKGLQLCKHTYA